MTKFIAILCGLLTATALYGDVTRSSAHYKGNVLIDGQQGIGTTSLGSDKLRVVGNPLRSSRADSTPSGTAASTTDDLILGSTDTSNTGMTIFGTGFTNINFGDVASSNAGAISYDHSGDQFRFRAGDVADVFTINSTNAEITAKTNGPTTSGNIFSETDDFTSTLSSQTNLDGAETCTVRSYMRVGKVIQYSFDCLINPTAAIWSFSMTVGYGTLQGTGSASQCNGGVGSNDFGSCAVRSSGTTTTVDFQCFDVNATANPPAQRLYGTFQCDVTN